MTPAAILRRTSRIQDADIRTAAIRSVRTASAGSEATASVRAASLDEAGSTAGFNNKQFRRFNDGTVSQVAAY